VVVRPRGQWTMRGGHEQILSSGKDLWWEFRRWLLDDGSNTDRGVPGLVEVGEEGPQDDRQLLSRPWPSVRRAAGDARNRQDRGIPAIATGMAIGGEPGREEVCGGGTGPGGERPSPEPTRHSQRHPFPAGPWNYGLNSGCLAGSRKEP
jgi:hypothetical protein